MLATLPLCPESPKHVLIIQGKEIAAQKGKSILLLKHKNKHKGRTKRVNHYSFDVKWLMLLEHTVNHFLNRNRKK
jgi:hypothetical protein